MNPEPSNSACKEGCCSPIRIDSITLQAQSDTEREVHNAYMKTKNKLGDNWQNELKHTRFLTNGLEYLGTGYQSLDASRPWLCFWIIHSLELLDWTPNQNIVSRMISFLNNCQDHIGGGFGGGPGQLAHCAPTYAAVSALLICGSQEAYKIINREKIYSFLMRMKQADGSFRMHENGEIDVREVLIASYIVRSTYCALAVASLCNIITPELTHNTAKWIASCQTFEGGIGAEPFNEAHGGYTYCGYASLVILNCTHYIDRQALFKWVSKRQMNEGGFQGRTYKLVDACYSFWQGAVFSLLDSTLLNSLKYLQTDEELEEVINSSAKLEKSKDDSKDDSKDSSNWFFDQEALQKYLIAACQDEHSGGIIDKPGKRSDYYHTCYGLSGLSVAQHNPFYSNNPNIIYGSNDNLIESTHPVYNITPNKLTLAMKYFYSLPAISPIQ